jgi:crotonobetainyl-CoA:carnitine CoA-transferase CaiB-like acyl-CoA transferase
MQPFQGIKVLDLAHVYTGPFCTYQLSVLGAEVLKIEPPDRPDMTRHQVGMAEPAPGMNLSYLTQNANKRALALDLKKPKGRDILKRLVKTYDVLVENHRAGVLDDAGLGYKNMSAINPRLIYCSITGFGQTGPKRGHGAFDPVIQALSGLMSVTGTPETAPVKVGSPVVDYGTGLYAAYAVSAALFQREKT